MLAYFKLNFLALRLSLAVHSSTASAADVKVLRAQVAHLEAKAYDKHRHLESQGMLLHELPGTKDEQVKSLMKAEDEVVKAEDELVTG